MFKLGVSLRNMAASLAVPLLLGVVAAGCSGGGDTNVTSIRSLAFSTALPANVTAGTAISPSFTVTIQDDNGNRIAGATDSVTLRLIGTTGGVLGGTVTQAAVDGTATFDDITVDKAGAGYSLLASAPNLVPAQSSAFQVDPLSASAVRFVRQPNNGIPVATLDTIEVEVVDSLGNRITTSTTQVTVTLVATNGAVFGGTTTVNALNGVASFSDLSVDRVGNYTATAGANGFAATATSSAFSISSPAVNSVTGDLAFTTQPVNTAELAVIAPSVVVQLRNSSGAVITTATDAVTISVGNNPGTATLSGNRTVNAVAGVATFPGLVLNAAGNGVTLVATANTYTTATSNPFNVTASAARRLTVIAQPPTSNEATAFGLQVRVEDSTGAAVLAATPVTIQLAGNPGGSVLGGTLTVNSSAATGVATFANLTLNKAGAGYQLRAVSGLLTPTLSAGFTIMPTTADSLFVTANPPATITEGTAFAVQVQVRDTAGANLATAGIPVTLDLSSAPNGGTLIGDQTVNTNAAGVAIFSLTLNGASGAGYDLAASSLATSRVLTTQFSVTASQAASMTAIATPAGVVENTNFAVSFQVRDAANAPLLVAGIPVTISLANNTAGGVLGGTLTVNTAASGIAAFSVNVDKAGDYQIAGSTNGATGATTGTFTAAATTARSLFVSADPPNVAINTNFGMSVQVRNSAGTAVATAGTPVTIQLASNPGGGILSGVLTANTDATGTAIFTNLTIDEGGTAYQVVATSTGLTSALTATFNITGANQTKQLVVTGGPTPAAPAEGVAFTITVQARDLAGTPITGVSIPITLVLANNPGSATLGGTTTVNTLAASGTATFGNLTLDKAGTGYQLLASASGVPTVLTSAFNIVASQASSLNVAVQPTGVTEGTAFTTNIQVRDSTGANLATAGIPVTLLLANAPNGGALSGDLTVNTDATGLAQFTNVVLTGGSSATATYRLLATSTGTTDVLTASFAVAASQAKSMTLFSPVNPVSPIEGANFIVEVRLQDAAGAPLTTAGIPVSLFLANSPANSGTLSGATTVNTAANGVATFNAVRVSGGAGAGFQLMATTAGATDFLITPAFAVVASTATKVAFTAGPTPSPVAQGANFGLTVQVQNSASGAVPVLGTPVTIQLASNPGGATLAGALTANTDIAGNAVFTNLTLNSAGVGYTIRATAAGLTDALSASLTVTAAGGSGATQLAILTGPTPAAPTENGTFTFTVQAQDAGGTAVTGTAIPVTLLLANNPGGAILSGTTTVNTTPATGIALITMTLDKVGTGYQLQASSAGLPSVLSAAFNVTASQAGSLSIVGAPAAATEGTGFGFSVQVRDNAGANLAVASIPVTLLLANNPGGGTLAGTRTVNTDATGLAIFAGLTLNDASGAGYQIMATSAGVPNVLTGAITVAPSQAASLRLSAPVTPVTPIEGANFTLAVQLQDSAGLDLTQANVPVTLLLGATPATGGELNGVTTALTAANGVATFSLATATPIQMNGAGNGFQILATAPGANSLAIPAFNVTAATATKAIVTTEPPASTAANIAFGLQVTLQDSSNTAVGVAGVPVTLAIANNPGGSILSGNTTATTNASGVAIFTGLTLNKAGTGYSLVATSPGLTAGYTAAAGFAITGSVATSLNFVSLTPTPNPAAENAQFTYQIQALDAGGTPINGVPVTLFLSSNPGGGVLSGTLTVTTSSGIANFPDLRLDQAANGYQILATSSGLPSALSGSFNVTGDTADHVTVVTQPPVLGVTENSAFTVGVQVEDISNNALTAGGIPVTLLLASNSGGSILSGDTTVATAAGTGIATFTVSLNRSGSDYQLVAVVGGLPHVLTTPFAISATQADALVITTQPAAATEGVNFPFAVQVNNSAGTGVAAGTDVTIQLASNTGGATLIGDLTASTLAGGLASFNVQLDRAGTDYQILATSPGVVAAISSAFAVTANTARNLAITTQPAASVSEITSFGLTVQLQDSANVNVALANVPVTLDLGNNPGGGDLTGTLTVNTNATGAAVFTNLLNLNQAGIGYTIRASSSGLTTALSTPFDVTAALARILVFTSDPNNQFPGAVINSPSGIEVSVRDSNNTPVLNQPTLVTLLIGKNPTNATLFGTLSVMSDNNGLATFDDIVIDKSGSGYRLTAIASGLTSAMSLPTTGFTILGTPVGTADHLIVPPDVTNPALRQPADANENVVISTVANNPAAAPIIVEIRDTLNALVGAASDFVTVQLGANPSGGVLSGTLTVQAVNGVATFNNLNIDKAGNGYTLTFTSNALTGATTNPFNIDPTTAKVLVFRQQPVASTGQNQAILAAATPVQVQLRNAPNTLDVALAGVPVTLSLGTNNPSSGTLSGGVTVLTDAAGLAVFPNLAIDQTGTNYTFVATAGAPPTLPLGSGSTLTPATSNNFNITPTEARALSFTQQPPANVNENATFTPNVTVQLLDQLGNPRALNNVRVSLTLANNSPGGILQGDLSVLTDGTGLATFTNVSINDAGAGYSLLASSGPNSSTSAITPVESNPVTVLPVTATQLVWTLQPTDTPRLAYIDTVAGPPTGQPVTVQLRDAANNLVTTSGVPVSLAFAANPPNGTLGGTLTQTTVNGVATFNDLTIDTTANAYSLVASAGPLTPGVSAPFNITGDPAIALSFTAGPTGTVPGVGFTTSVAAITSTGATDTAFTGNIAIRLANNPGTATLGGLLVRPAILGVADFTLLTLDEQGTGYTLQASSPSLTDAVSNPFNMSSAPFRNLVMVNQPSNTNENAPIDDTVGAGGASISVQVQEGGVNSTLANVPVTVSIGTNPGPGALSGTLTAVTNAFGVATFTVGFAIDTAANGYQLRFEANGLQGVTSNTFNVLPVTPNHLAWTVQPTNTARNANVLNGVAPLEVTIQDGANNLVSVSGVPVTVVFGANPGNGTLGGTLTQTTVNGVATFPNFTVDTTADGYSLVAFSNGLTQSVSSSFNVTGDPAIALQFDAAIATPATPGVGFGASVSAITSTGAVDTTFVGNITLSIANNPGTGTLGGLITRPAVLGTAAFTGLTMDEQGAGYTLAAAASGLTNTVSSAFTVSPAPFRQLVLVQQPTNANENALITDAGLAQIQVQVQEGGVNSSLQGVPVTVSIGTNPAGGTLNGTMTAITNVAGIATFAPGFSIDTAGTGYQLRFEANGLQGVTSTAINVVSVTPTQLTWTTQPANAARNGYVDDTAGPGGFPLQVTLQDAGNNTVLANGVPITVDFGANPPNGTLGGTQIRTTVNGVATFNDLTIDTTGNGYSLAASSAGLPAEASATFNVTGDPAVALQFDAAIVTPGSPGVGFAASVSAITSTGATDMAFTGLITVSLANNPSSATLGGTLTMAATAGTANFTGLTLSGAGTGYTLAATSPSLTNATSSAFTMNGNILAWTTQPTAGARNVNIPGVPTVSIRESTNTTNVALQGIPITVSIAANPSAGVLAGTRTVNTDAAGDAVFPDLQINNAGTGYTLIAATPTITPTATDTSAAFNIAGGVGQRLVWTNSPTDTARNTNLLGTPTVTVTDAGGTAIPVIIPVTVSIAANPAFGILGGTRTVTTSAAGVAVFSDLQINNAAAAYTLSAAAGGFDSGVSVAFAITGPPATRLRFTDHPVAVQQGSNQLDPNGGGLFDLATVATPIPAPFPILPGSVRITLTDGAATLQTISDVADPATPGFGLLVGTGGILPNAASTYTIDYSNGNLTGVTAALQAATPIDETHETSGGGDPTVGFTTVVEALTAAGERDTAFVGNITVAVANNPGSGTLGGTLVLQATAGVASFANLTLDNTGTGYTLSATSPSLTDALSGAFNMSTNNTGLTLVVVNDVDNTNSAIGALPADNFDQGESLTTVAAGNGGPGASISVRLQDAGGNNVLTNGVPVYLTIANNAGGGTLSGTLVQATAGGGIATFAGVSIDKIGTGYTLGFAANGVTGTLSQAFTVQSSTPTAVSFSGQPLNTTVNGAFPPTVTVDVRDGLGRLVTGNTGVTLVIGNNPGAATLGGNSTVITATGQAAFPTITMSQPGIANTLWALVSGLLPVESNPFNITGSSNKSLSFTAPGAIQPASGAPGALTTVQVAVLLNGAVDLTSTDLVTLDLGSNPGGATLGGTRTVLVTGGTGIATFTGLTMDQLGTGFTLVAHSGGVTPTLSTAFNVALTFTATNVARNAGDANDPLSTYSIATGERNGTAGVDLLVVDADNTAVGVGNGRVYDLFNNGTGTFTANAAFLTAAAEPDHFAVGDFNGVLQDDYVLADRSVASHLVYDSANALVATLAKGFGSRVVRTGTFFATAGLDVVSDRDGLNPNGDRFDGNGAGVFGAATGITTTPNTIGVGTGDLSGDGFSDLVFGTGGANLVLVNQTAAGTFAAEVAITGPAGLSSGWVEVVDLNGDGNLDLLVSYANGANTDLYGFLNDGSGNFGAATLLVAAAKDDAAASRTRPVVADVTGDGRADLIVPAGTNGVRIYERANGSLLTFRLGQTLTTRVGIVTHVVVADFDGNGIPDIAATGTGSTSPATVWIR